MLTNQGIKEDNKGIIIIIIIKDRLDISDIYVIFHLTGSPYPSTMDPKGPWPGMEI